MQSTPIKMCDSPHPPWVVPRVASPAQGAWQGCVYLWCTPSNTAIEEGKHPRWGKNIYGLFREQPIQREAAPFHYRPNSLACLGSRWNQCFSFCNMTNPLPNLEHTCLWSVCITPDSQNPPSLHHGTLDSLDDMYMHLHTKRYIILRKIFQMYEMLRQ